MKRLLFAGVLALAGCAARQWVPPPDRAQGFDRDNYECQREAVQMFPPAYSTITVPTYGPTSKTSCRTSYTGTVKCETTEREPTTITGDDNQREREAAAGSCLRARGYRWEKVDTGKR